MARQAKTFRFKTRLAPIDAVFMKTVIFVPEDIVEKLPQGRVRVEGTCNGAPFALAIQHLKDGQRYLSVGAALRRAARIREGDVVDVVFRPVNPDKLDLPDELQAVLEQDEAARKAWQTLPRGHQRGLVHYIVSAKTVDTRIARSIELLERAKAGRLHGQRQHRNGPER